jgi:hypothetical protein
MLQASVWESITDASEIAQQYSSDVTDNSASGYGHKLSTVMSLMYTDAQSLLCSIDPATQRAAAAEAHINSQTTQQLLHSVNHTLQSAKQTAVYPEGYTKTGKSTLITAYIQERLQKKREYYATHYRGAENVLKHELVDTTGVYDAAAKAQAATAQAALYTEMYKRVSGIFPSKYKLDRLLSSQSACATTTSALRIESCGSDVPTIEITYKDEAEVLPLLTEVQSSMIEYEDAQQHGVPCKVTVKKYLAIHQMLKQATHV